MKFKEGDIIKHYKRDLVNEKEQDKNMYLYKVIAFAMHTETEEKMLVYQALYHPFKCYVRPMDMVTADVPKDRFAKEWHTRLQEKVFELYFKEQ